MYREAVRGTLDVDLLISCDADDLRSLGNDLEGRGWERGNKRADWLLKMHHPQRGPVDIVTVETEYECAALARANRIAHAGCDIAMLAVEDVIVHKLIANRFRDEQDIESILMADAEMDWAYVGKWADFWDVRARLERVQAVVAETKRARERLNANPGTMRPRNSDGHSC